MFHEEEKKQYVLHIQQSWARVIFFSTCKRLQVILFYPVCHASPRCFSLSPIVTVSHKSIFLKCTYKFFTASSIFETQAHLAQPHTNLYGGQSPPPPLQWYLKCVRGGCLKEGRSGVRDGATREDSNLFSLFLSSTSTFLD